MLSEMKLFVIQHAEELAPLLNGPVSPTGRTRSYTWLTTKRRGSSVKQSEEHKRLYWWKQAEEAIRTAEELLTGQSGATIDNLRQIIRDAKKQLDREAPKKAFELACVIPIQLQADGDARERAVEVLNDAAKALKGTDGFDTSELEQRLNKQNQHLKQETLVNRLVLPKESFV